VASKRKKVALEVLYIYCKVGHRLRRVDQDFGSNPMRDMGSHDRWRTLCRLDQQASAARQPQP
jgi:hypothetical protein